MSEARWSDYLDWLSRAGLLTTFVQSRAPKAGVSASLDELRQGNAGEPIPREVLRQRRAPTRHASPLFATWISATRMR